MSDRAINIVGVGSTLMGDDGVGPAVIEALQRRGIAANVQLHDAGLAVSDVLGRLHPDDPLIVIDALRAGGKPGSVYKARLEDLSLNEGSFPRCLSLHELSVLPALRIEALTGREFKDVTIFAVEPETIDWGEGLSATVTGAIEKLIQAVLQHVEQIDGRCHAAAGDTSR